MLQTTIIPFYNVRKLEETNLRTYIWYDNENLLISGWKPSSSAMNETDFKNEAKILAELITLKNPEKLLLIIHSLIL